MKLSEEDTSGILVNDMPKQEEYSQILYDAQDVGRLVDTNYTESQEANNKAWTGIYNLMARCIARGMRLAKEGRV